MSKSNKRHLSTKPLQPLLASCDKLILRTSSFDIRPKAKLHLHPYLVDLSRDENEEQFPLYTDTDGQPVFGQFAHNNNDTFQLDIQRKNGCQELTLQFNPNKVGTTGHYYRGTTDTDQRNAQILSVNDELLKAGIHLDFEGMKLKRADFEKTQQFDVSLPAHRSIFEALSAKRAKTRNHYDTYYIGNKEWIVATYDKSIESNIPNAKNLIRCEPRAYRGRTCQSLYGIKTLSDVLATDVETFTQRYNQILLSKVFHNHSAGKEQVATEIAKIGLYVDEYGNSGFGRYLQNTGIPQVFKHFGNLEAIMDVLLQHYSKQTAYKWKKRIAGDYAENIALSDRAESLSARLYDNLYSFAI